LFSKLEVQTSLHTTCGDDELESGVETALLEHDSSSLVLEVSGVEAHGAG